jgi:hypothetical protein
MRGLPNRPSRRRCGAPQICRRVVAITQGNDGSLSIDGDGVPVEFAIDIGAIDWDIIDASGTPEQTLEQCQARITHREAA